MSAEKRTFRFGDAVIHTIRPEWGRGVVTRAEPETLHGKPGQRLHVRFAAAGMKVLHSGTAGIVAVDEAAHVPAALGEHSNGSPAGTNGAGWIGALENVRPEDVMLRLPDPAKDPFKTVWQRLQFTLDLYRFHRDPQSITQWALAQSGLTDPLSHFTRHELDEFFDRWMRLRDEHLGGLITEAERTDAEKTKAMLAEARVQFGPVVQRAYVRR